jgi:hypothetical protein
MRRALLLGLCLAGWLGGIRLQSETVVASTNPERRGSGDLSVSYQSYYNRVNGAAVANVHGGGFLLRHFFPRSGLLTLQLEPLANAGNFALGENYLQWTGLPWLNRHWDFSAGDFRAATALVDAPFPNLSLPELSLRGGRATARSGGWSLSLFGGAETLSQGNRVPFRTRVPQNAVGVQFARNPEDRVQFGLGFLRLSSSPQRVAEERLFFPTNRQFTASDTLTTQARVRLTRSLDWFSEAGWSSVSELGRATRRSEWSFVAGPALHTSHVSIRANYLSQGTGYMPVLGYYLGDRRGSNVDGLWTIGPVSLHGNWVQSRNNRERNSLVPNFYSRQGGGGVQLRLPARFFVSGSMSNLVFESDSPEAEFQRNDNRQFLLMISRPVYRHNLHASWQRLDSRLLDRRQRLEFLEVEDNYAWRRLSAGAAVRWQRFTDEQERNSLFIRTSGQYQLRNLSVYGYWEHGKDLESSTLFSTQIASTSVIGMSWAAPGELNVRMEAFRNQLNTVLSSENLFVLGSRGIAPDSLLSRSDDWSLFLRISRQLSWGEPFALRSDTGAQPEAPLLGTLAGYVKVNTMAGPLGAKDIWVLTDTGQAARTDENGYFQIPEVPQGARFARLDLDRLPADLDPPADGRFPVEIRSGQLSRLDLEVEPLSMVQGTVLETAGEPAVEGIIVRLLPDNLRTTTDSLGRFGFYNLREGDYEVQVEESSLPPSTRLEVSTLRAEIRYGEFMAPLGFHYSTIVPEAKPTRRVLTERQQAMAEPGAPGDPARRTSSPGNAARRMIAGTAAKPTPQSPAKQERRVTRWVAR